MHDPMTVAHEIRFPWRSDRRPRQLGESDGSYAFRRRYRESFITIWHVDPEDHSVRQGRRDDDSCGWFTPPTTPEERDRIRKLGESEWSSIFGRRAAMAEGKSYAYVAFAPTTHDAIYWAWRRIKYENRKGWNFGDRRVALSRAEEQAIYSLASNPVDNLQTTVAHVKDAESCGSFFLTVYNAFQRHHRPWWQHPRWHVQHWKFQVHPLQKLNRRLFVRCSVCGGRFGWNESVTGSWGGDKLWHGRCDTAKAPPKAAA